MVAVAETHRDIIFDAVRGMYSHLADTPTDEFHFATGREALEYVGYTATELEGLPTGAVESFAGVAHPFEVGAIRPGDDVLDIGSGSGTDVLIASRLVGPEGSVTGLDMTAAMREKLLGNAARIGATNVRVIDGNAEDIPLPDNSIDVITSNGVLNLVPDKERAIREIFRVLRPGGRIQISDIVVDTLPSAACRAEPQLWAECIVGAVTQEQFVDTLDAVGFEALAVAQRVDYFAASPSESTRKTAAGFNAHAVVIAGRKPE